MASQMEAALATERAALKGTGGIVDGSVAVGVKPSTPRSPADVRPERIRSRELSDFPVPTGREEEWRFTPLERLRPLLNAATSDTGLDVTVDSDQAGVTYGPLSADDPLLERTPLPVDRLAVLSQVAGSTTALRIEKAAEIAAAVILRRSGSGSRTGHLVIEVAEQARVTVVLDHTGSARYNGTVSVLVGDGARLDLVSVQAWEADALHAEHVAYRIGRDAQVRGTQVSLGGDLVRITETVEFDGPGGGIDLRGVSFADARQHLEHRLFVDHTAPNCRSRVTYKSALQGDQAHTVWVGDVLIRAGASGTDTYELNRNLLLTPEARADSVPNLEIETGEIAGAGHASATGRFEDEQLFYLQSRGIPADVARRMVVRGFFAEIVESVGVPDLEERLMAVIEAELERVYT